MVKGTWVHRTVLLNEAITALLVNPDGHYIDATFGRGGHSRLLLSQLSALGRLTAFDKDLDAIAEAQSINDPRFSIRHQGFMHLGEVPPASVAGDGRLQITYVADCWTQVTDGNGKVLFSALKRKGDTLDQGGKPPLTRRLGFGRGAQGAYTGQAGDVAPFTSGETARLKLGQ